MSKSLTLIKLGGSIITDKTRPDTLRPEILADLIGQIVAAKRINPAEQFLLAHGQGSFAHFPAHKYETKRGLINSDSLYGLALVLDAVGSLNRLVIHECVKQSLPAVSWMSAQGVITQAGGQPSQSWLEILKLQLNLGLLPVTSGDVVMDEAQSWAIWSGETILGFLATELQKSGYKITKLIQVGEVAGVLDQTGRVIPELSAQNLSVHQAAITSTTKGVDVTGGMLLKVAGALDLVKKTGIESWIVAGLEPNNLFKALTGESWSGTRITD